MKKWIKKSYRVLLYPWVKVLERYLRGTIFFLLELAFPRFNAFRCFGVPRGVKSVSGDEVVPSGHTIRQELKTLDQDLVPRFTPLQIPTPGGAIAVLPNGFCTATAAALTDKGRLVPEFTEQFTMSHIYRHKLFTFRFDRCFAQIPHFDTTVASLTVDGQWNYYHWLFDALPKLYLMRQKGLSADYYYADTTKHFQKESLRCFGIEAPQTICPHQHPMISAASLIVSSFPCLQGIPPWVCEFLRNTFAPPAETNTSKISRVFISRRSASYRRILNEEELYPLLEQEGFTIIQAETLSFAQQIALFKGADVILAPHGAGLANLVFCRPGTKVVEIFPPRFPCTCYWTLSSVVHLDYYSLCGRDDASTYSSECEGYDHIMIDANKVKKTLEWALHH